MRYITSEAVADVLTKRIFPRHGTPNCILTDRGPQFVSHVFRKLMKLHGVIKLYTSAYHPQGNGIAEAFMKVLGHSLSTLVGNRPKDWDQYCEQVALAYRATPHPSTGETPFYLMHGRDLKLPVNRAVESLTSQVLPLTTLEKNLKTHLETLQEAHKDAQEALRRVHQVSSHKYDKDRKDVRYQVGDLVHVKLSFHELQDFPSSKLAPKWSEPERIVKVLDNGSTFDVGHLLTGETRRVHALRLKPHQSVQGSYSPLNLREVTDPLTTPPTWKEEETQERYESAIIPPEPTSHEENEDTGAREQPKAQLYTGPASGLRRTDARRANELLKEQERQALQ